MLVMSTTRMMAQGVYRIPKIAYETAVAITNTTPMGAFRGAGRPEAAAFLERIIDMAADELDIDPVELRRRNFLRPDQFPYTTLMGPTYDNGDYDGALTEALRLAGYDELRAEQAAPARARRPVPARHRRQRVRRGDGDGGQRVRRCRGPRGRDRHGAGRDVGSRPGAPDLVRHDRRRPARGPAATRSGSSSPTPRTCRAAAGRAVRGRCSSAGAPWWARPTPCWPRRASTRRGCSRRRPTTSS